MSLQIDLLTKVFPGKSSAGALGLSTCALLRTEAHTMLFDTGAHGAIKILQASLEGLGVSPEQVDAIFLSHLHYDHLNNVALYPNALLIAGRREWEYATRTKDEWTPLESVLYLRDHRRVRLVEDGEEVFPGMRAIWTPGHTPGHMSLALDTPEGTLVLAGDAVKNRSELELEYADQCVDLQASSASIQRIKGMACRVLPGHDGWLLLQNGRVVPERELTLDVMLPRGCQDGENGVFHLSVK